jgi:hypothetical protein
MTGPSVQSASGSALLATSRRNWWVPSFTSGFAETFTLNCWAAPFSNGRSFAEGPWGWQRTKPFLKAPLWFVTVTVTSPVRLSLSATLMVAGLMAKLRVMLASTSSLLST